MASAFALGSVVVDRVSSSFAVAEAGEAEGVEDAVPYTSAAVVAVVVEQAFEQYAAAAAAVAAGQDASVESLTDLQHGIQVEFVEAAFYTVEQVGFA